MATQLATRDEQRASPVQVFRQTLGQMTGQLKMALPAHISVEKFQRVATTAVQTSPNLLDPNKCDRGSLFGALVKAAQDGLLPDGREGAIVPYKGKAQWQPMVAGVMKKVRNSGEVASWDVAAVYERDEFQRLLGDDQRIFHKPFEDGDPGQVIGAYSIVTFKDGTKSRDYMPRWRIEKARAQGLAKDSLMWSQFYDEGAIKTVIKHHGKRLPMSTDIEALFEHDDTMAHARSAVAIMSAGSQEAGAPPVSRLDALEQRIGANDGTLSSENPAASEGRDDSQMGERTDADELIDMYGAADDSAAVLAAGKAAQTLNLADSVEVCNAREAAMARIGGAA